MVSLVLGLTALVRSSADAKRAAKREHKQRQGQSYVDLLRIVERRGLAVQDDMYNQTETGDERSMVQMPRRSIDWPPRSDRAEAVALATAYGVPAVKRALNQWIDAVDAWEQKSDSFAYTSELNGPQYYKRHDAEPERANELSARKALSDSIIQALQWGRGAGFTS
jgi:hypothetical protein